MHGTLEHGNRYRLNKRDYVINTSVTKFVKTTSPYFLLNVIIVIVVVIVEICEGFWYN